MKKRGYITRLPIMLLVFYVGIMPAGCTTTKYHVEISNVRNISEIYIRNAGSISWGSNMVNNLNDIDKSRYSNRVDIRVVDSSGIVYSKLNVPFGDNAFIETDKTTSMNIYAIIGVLGVAGLIFSITGQ